MKRNILAVAVGAALALNAFSAFAESSSAAGGTGGSTSANLDFRLTIPKFLRLQVGTVGVGNIDLIDFAPTVAQLATTPSTVVNATAGSGDLGNGAVTVSVQANPNTDVVNLTYTTTAANLSDGGTNTVPWSTIGVATSGADAASLTHPATLADGSAGDVNVVAPVTVTGGVINLSAIWTYTWNDGGTIYPAATYTGRVAYRISTP